MVQEALQESEEPIARHVSQWLAGSHWALTNGEKNSFRLVATAIGLPQGDPSHKRSLLMYKFGDSVH
eukprot:2316108-Amphidinium_carterae.1